jgi:hypothetical protein
MAEDLVKTKIANNTLLDFFTSGQEKRAQDAINDYTRIKIREDGFLRRILPPVQITNDELDRAVDTDKPVKIIDKEPDSPAAVSVPFGTQPQGRYIEGPKYRVMFQRSLTPKFYKDIEELRTYTMDIRQILSDNSIKDVLAEEDGKFIAAVNAALVGANVVLPTSGVAQYQTIAGGVTRDSLWDSFKVMPSTPSNLEVHTVLINNITIKEVAKFGRNEMGGDLSVDIMRKGWSEEEFMGVRWIVTIKKTLVPNNHMFMFADPKFIGKHYQLEDTTLHVKREAYMIEFFAYETAGATLGHFGGLAHVQFT